MSKRVLDVGNCGPDHAAIRNMLVSLIPGVDVSKANNLSETLESLRGETFDLILINRKLDEDYSDGLEILKHLKQDPDLADIPTMMVTNYEEHQQAAVEAGAILGFGKLSLQSTETHERLQAVLVE